MPRLKFVATSIARSSAPGQGGFQTVAGSTTAMYIESNAVTIQPEGTTTLIIDKVSGDQYHCSQTYSTTITRMDTASASPANAIDLS